MILLSLALVIASVVTLGWGLATTTQPLVWGSVLAGLAAAALVVGSVVRRRGRLTLDPGEPAPAPAPDGKAVVDRPPGDRTAPAAGTPAVDRPPGGDPTAPAAGTPAAGRPAGADPTDRTPAVDPGTATTPPSADLAALTERPLGEPFPPPTEPAAAGEHPTAGGEPAVEDVAVGDALRVAQLADDVVVVDGHPRYHLAGCPTLAGAPPVPLAVSAARRAGFTPCAVCGPDRTLLARSRARRTGQAGTATAAGSGAD